jgi:hypothetical protein
MQQLLTGGVERKVCQLLATLCKWNQY